MHTLLVKACHQINSYHIDFSVYVLLRMDRRETMNKESDFSSNPQPGVSKVEIRLCLITYMYNIYTKCYTRYCQN